MKYDKDEKKLKPEIKLPGDAWMDHVEKNHNASAVNPLTVAPSNKKLTDLEKRLDVMQKEMASQKTSEPQKELKKQKNIEHGRD